MFPSIMRILLLSKLVRLCRRMISSMRGCCHRPGVDGAGEGGCCCCRCGVDVDDVFGVVFCVCGVRFSLGKAVVDVNEVEADLGWGCEVVRLLLEDDDRTRAVVDIAMPLL